VYTLRLENESSYGMRRRGSVGRTRSRGLGEARPRTWWSARWCIPATGASSRRWATTCRTLGGLTQGRLPGHLVPGHHDRHLRRRRCATAPLTASPYEQLHSHLAALKLHAAAEQLPSVLALAEAEG
jgi:hypothetical protein